MLPSYLTSEEVSCLGAGGQPIRCLGAGRLLLTGRTTCWETLSILVLGVSGRSKDLEGFFLKMTSF